MSAVFFLSPLAADAPEPEGGFAQTVRPTDEAVISLRDAGIVRGDGIFETLGVRNRAVQAETAHLTRLAHSAQLLELPAPNLSQWRAALAIAADTLPAEGTGSIRLSLTRGVPGEGPSAWLIAEEAPADLPERHSGLAVVSLERGLSVHASEHTPWLLAGAKTLSYAINMAALREAKSRGADDVLFISTEGLALEGPTSSLLIYVGGEFVSPPRDEAILAGTTVDAAFDWLRTQGYTCVYRQIPAETLSEIDGAWLLSSVRMAAPIRTLDGVPVTQQPELNESLVNALVARTR
ncbi:aminotransferase class IV [Mycetocola saprophilus]|uniref:aminotransferase class IV n=1 Tax=Mycetocola saprophilus TaxID=76636 RepID=UPI0004BEB49A|nr:aminotransferase class IV [Mycetocola saprophilus]